MRLFTCLLAALFLSGCASASVVWKNDSKDQSSFAKDDYECDRDAHMMPRTKPRGMFGDISHNVEMGDLYEKCLASKGWYKITVPK